MGELEDRLKGNAAGSPAAEKPKAKSVMEKALEEADAEDAKDIQRAQTRRRVAEENVRTREAEQRLRNAGGSIMGETEEEKRERELKEAAKRVDLQKSLYSTCIECGGDPTTCAQVVAGIIPSHSPTTMVAPQPTSVTELIHALTELDQLRGSDKGMVELKLSFDKLAEEIRRGGTNQQPLDPVTFAKQQAEAVSAWHKAIQEITPTPSVTATGESLEVVQEKNRHEEKMGEVQAERDYKTSVADTLATLPERIGRGLGGQILEREAASIHRGGDGDAFDTIDCECGNKIHIAPGADSATCGDCKTTYTRKGTVETG